MTFKLSDEPADIAAALRSLEADERKLSPTAKALIVMAATELDDQRKLLQDISTELSAASKMHVGMMDSQSRADEVARHIKSTMVSLDARIKELLARPHALQPPPDAAVI